ncbi:hypothetical protein BBK36DRAFT_21576 [Trichoderma citrinoviride]|uniref:Uncharacterized protein n=1 Tax=Trichoderma citrinoviride TaxID=58853 RepID=A0A2T4B693_9HYPO|nr:hypothetical protein BBK36DRAFT_21576 [Trichoderma citrinoviride]PTB64845.1 hypothetical protein BBK36DRAFT_21576 [Trichoderma citrinoviride]
MGDPIVNLGLSCPKGGRFYICEDQPARFMGCCTSDPCTTADGLCPDDELRPGSFSSDAYSKILAQDCLDPGFLWYTCRDSSPPFLGCCSQNACESTGCPVSKVGAATLAGNKQRAAPFLSGGASASSGGSSSSAAKTTSSASAPSTTLSTVLSTAAASTTGDAPPKDSTQPDAVSPPAHPGLSKGAIAGIAVGAIVAVCAFAFLFFWLFKQHKKRSSTNMAPADGGSGRKDEYGGEDSLAEQHRDGTLLGVGATRGGAGQIPQAEPSPGLDSVISELPASPSQHSITSGATPGRPIVSMVSASGATGRESDASGYTAKEHSPLIHQTLFELEDSSIRER